MGIFGKLFGSAKVIDAGIKGIDAAFYTEEEKDAALERRMGLKTMMLKAYEPFKVAQRFLAVIYGVPYISAWLATFVASFFMDISAQINLLTESLVAEANLIILAFYFLGGAGESIMRYRMAGKKKD